MKTKILKVVSTLDIDQIIGLTSFIEDDDMSGIKDTDYDLEDLRGKVGKFFDSKTDQVLKTILKDLKAHDVMLHDLFVDNKPKVARPTVVRPKTEAGETLTPNQKLVMSKINRLVKASSTGKTRTDSVVIKDKSKFFVGGVLTTLVEKGVITIAIEDKKKFISLTEKSQ